MKKVLLPLVMCVMFLSGCDLLGPSFSVDDGKRVIHRIMNRNASSFSEDGDKTFVIDTISFQKNDGDQREYYVRYWGRLNGELYKYGQVVFVGKDEGGWYVKMFSQRNTESLQKFRE